MTKTRPTPTERKHRGITVRPGPEILTAMQRLQDRDGISPSEQTRRALAAFLEKKGVLTPAKRTTKGGTR